uniref:Ig-like domain-containing protein n=1 Tax=Neogobius melanostomus TaxID=47308 RepID=A0A8C6U083_9GOBI
MLDIYLSVPKYSHRHIPILTSPFSFNYFFFYVMLQKCVTGRNEAGQAGPLYRVEGSPLSISCSVSGLPPLPDGRNNFEFRVKKPSKPNLVSHVISTESSDFAYAAYGQRVKAGEIMVEHVDQNSVLFKILRLEKTDEGEYECAVINTRGTFYGTYSAMTTVKVIDNSLSVSSPAPASLTQTEGDSVDFTCEVSSNTVQHTHLSFAWFLGANTEAAGRPLISMDKDFRLIPGPGFEERYKAGLIRLDKIGEVTYKLKMSHLELSDQGALYCEAQEWIQDPDRTWYSIAKKAAEKTILTVKPKVSYMKQLNILTPQKLFEGQRLTVSCAVDTQNLKEKFFSLAWLRGGVELARVGPTGVLTVGPDYSSREREGELRAARIGERDYSLILQPVRTSDQGAYVCRAWPEERSSTGDFTQGAYQDSAPHAVAISATGQSGRTKQTAITMFPIVSFYTQREIRLQRLSESNRETCRRMSQLFFFVRWPWGHLESGLQVEMANNKSVKEGNKLELSCRVSGVTGQLSVTWQRQSASNPSFSDLIRLDQDGVMAKAEGSLDVSVRALRPAPDLFSLELEEATQADDGVYQCVVSEWKTNNKASSQVATSTVSVTSLGIVANTNADIELKCSVSSSLLMSRYAVTWLLGKQAENKMIVRSDQDAFLTFGPEVEPSLRQRLSVTRTEGPSFILTIRNARSSDIGVYMCEVVQWQLDTSQQWHQFPLSPKAHTSDLHLNTTAPVLTVKEGDDVELTCSLFSEVNSPSVFYKVIWLYSEHIESGKIPLVELDHTGLLTYPTHEEVLYLQERLRLERSTQSSFNLGIRTVHEEDSGMYVCRVEQYQLDRDGQWQQKASKEMSPVLLQVNVTGMINVKIFSLTYLHYSHVESVDCVYDTVY